MRYPVSYRFRINVTFVDAISTRSTLLRALYAAPPTSVIDAEDARAPGCYSIAEVKDKLVLVNGAL